MKFDRKLQPKPVKVIQHGIDIANYIEHITPRDRMNLFSTNIHLKWCIFNNKVLNRTGFGNLSLFIE